MLWIVDNTASSLREGDLAIPWSSTAVHRIVRGRRGPGDDTRLVHLWSRGRRGVVHGVVHRAAVRRLARLCGRWSPSAVPDPLGELGDLVVDLAALLHERADLLDGVDHRGVVTAREAAFSASTNGSRSQRNFTPSRFLLHQKRTKFW